MTKRHFTLYAYPFRSRAERVLWALKEFDYSFDVIRLDPANKWGRSDFSLSIQCD